MKHGIKAVLALSLALAVSPAFADTTRTSDSNEWRTNSETGKFETGNPPSTLSERSNLSDQSASAKHNKYSRESSSSEMAMTGKKHSNRAARNQSSSDETARAQWKGTQSKSSVNQRSSVDSDVKLRTSDGRGQGDVTSMPNENSIGSNSPRSNGTEK